MSAPPVRPFAMSGWETMLPRTLRLFEIDGSHRRGRFALADATHSRLHVSWDAISRSLVDPKAFVDRRLAKAAGLPVAELAHRRIAITGSRLAPLHRYDDATGGRQIYIGYCPATRRGIQLVHKPSGDRGGDDALVDAAIEKHLRGQDPAAGQRWAFFGISFTAPPYFVQEAARLELGDMQIELIEDGSARRKARIEIRFIYPASLAMARGPLEGWLEGMVRKTANTYRPDYRQKLRRKGIIFEPLKTAVGPGVVTEAKLRTPAGLLLYRRHARYQQNYAVHASEHGKLLLVRIATAAPDLARPLLDKLLLNLDWAATAEGEA